MYIEQMVLKMVNSDTTFSSLNLETINLNKVRFLDDFVKGFLVYDF